MTSTSPLPLNGRTASAWCNSARKRMLDVIVSGIALIASAPILFVIAVAIRSTSPGPVLFRQWRLGLNGKPFQLMKFRTMRIENSGPGVTRSGDSRVTRLGKWLRQWKLDELPQLINVFRGDMSIVGPRPDLEQFWQQVTDVERQALAAKPGLTGAATLAFRNEEELLAEVPESELPQYYVRDLLPRKARLDCEYATQATFWSDCRISMKTVLCIFSTDSKSPNLRDVHEQVPR